MGIIFAILMLNLSVFLGLDKIAEEIRNNNKKRPNK